MDRVSVPLWGTFLSEPLSIVALVGRYPANKLMERIPTPYRSSLIILRCLGIILSGINLSFERLSPSMGQVGYVLLTRAPVATQVLPLCDAPRLACVKPVASVHPEPGSNSSLLYLVSFLFQKSKARHLLLFCLKQKPRSHM